MLPFRFESGGLPESVEPIRRRVRAFLADELAAGRFRPMANAWNRPDPTFSRRAGAAGFIGVTFPKEYGGAGLSSLDRYVVVEEMLAAGAPCGSHYIADRQSGPSILRHGSERARREIVPRIAHGECYFAIGMSEPNSGSDLAAARTRATPVEGGWRINGSKIWTSGAHHAHYLILLARTGPAGESRHGGLTQFIVDLAQPGVKIRPIINLPGDHDFNEVFFDDYFVPADMLIGAPGSGWATVTGELAYERSGPDRFLSDFSLFTGLIDRVGPQPAEQAAQEIGRLYAQLYGLREMSTSIATLLEQGADPMLEAAIVKDLGTHFEREIPEIVRKVLAVAPDQSAGADPFSALVAKTLLHSPSFTLRGGTREILRGMIARGLGLR